ncbi:hypothetical protein [Sagittula sp. MA-2]|nr:hypothetical protein [Sagittula sp. MA-2]WHZ33329.1 hypothetical protein QNI11_11735 [Sagittula sp. MA-2]
MAKCSRAGVEVYQYLGMKMPFHPNWIKAGGYFGAFISPIPNGRRDK